MRLWVGLRARVRMSGPGLAEPPSLDEPLLVPRARGEAAFEETLGLALLVTPDLGVKATNLIERREFGAALDSPLGAAVYGRRFFDTAPRR